VGREDVWVWECRWVLCVSRLSGPSVAVSFRRQRSLEDRLYLEDRR